MTNKRNSAARSSLRDWMFRAVTFESEADKFRTAGIRLGADRTEIEQSLLEQVLAPFPVIIRNNALRMTRLYALMNCFENSVRQLIEDRLEEKHGIDWWEQKTPKKVRDLAADRQLKANNNSWIEGDKTDPLQFIEFGHLADIIVANWEDFSDLIPSQHWLKQRMEELEQTRNFIAHNRLLLDSEFQRIEMYISDWNKQVGV